MANMSDDRPLHYLHRITAFGAPIRIPIARAVLRYYPDSINTRYNGASEPPNHGKPWATHEYEILARMFCDGEMFSKICCVMGRTGVAIVAKLKQLGLIECRDPDDQDVDHGSYSYRCTRAHQDRPAGKDVDTCQPTETKEDPMNTQTKPVELVEVPLIETRTFIEGVPANTLDDAALYSIIKRMENEVDRMEAIKNKPVKLKVKIAHMLSDIQKLVDFVDAR